MDNLNNLNENTNGQNWELIPHEQWIKEKGLDRIISYGGSRANCYGNSSIPYVMIQVSGEELFQNSNFKLTLKQKIGEHHELELQCDPGEFNEDISYPLQNSRKLLGKRITIQFRQFGEMSSLFTGIITQVSDRRMDDTHHIIITGKSPTILMENGQNSRSFQNQSFEEILKKVAQNYPTDLFEFDINPNFKETLPYVVQSNESDFKFLQRLATRYGEYFYYNGSTVIMSPWGSKIVECTQEEDVFNYEIKMKVTPQIFSYMAYDPVSKEDYLLNSEEANSPVMYNLSNPFYKDAYGASENLFTVHPLKNYDQDLLNKGVSDVNQSVNIEKSRRKDLVYLEAKTKNPKLRCGDIIKMNAWMPGHKTFKTGKIPLESYRVVEIEHYFEDGEGYYNTLVAVPKELPVPPYTDENVYPRAELCHAVVTDTDDPKKMGRIRVQFGWQKLDNEQTPWIQVIQPHAGVGKGTYFNPEKGETVMVAFQAGNAEKPIVVGTAYNGNEIAEYYMEGNHLKVIQTRSGTRIVFNDAEGSILITDPSGNSWHMDGQGNISVDAPNDINLSAGKNINISAGRDINTTIGANQNISVGLNSSTNVGMQYSLFAGDIHEQSAGDITSRAKDIEENAAERVSSAEGKTNFHSGENFHINSGEKSNLY